MLTGNLPIESTGIGCLAVHVKEWILDLVHGEGQQLSQDCEEAFQIEYAGAYYRC